MFQQLRLAILRKCISQRKCKELKHIVLVD